MIFFENSGFAQTYKGKTAIDLKSKTKFKKSTNNYRVAKTVSAFQICVIQIVTLNSKERRKFL